MAQKDTSILEVYSDGGSRGNPGPSASAFLVFYDGDEVFQFKKFIGKNTNNWAEYYAIYLALLWINKNKKDFKFEKINYYLDSELAVKQLSGEYKVKSDNLKNIFEKIKIIEEKIGKDILYIHIPRDQNKNSDALVNLALDENI
jgi:ribonuclease HI